MFTKDVPFSLLNCEILGNLTKTAATFREDLSEDIKDYIRKIKPEEGHTYFLASPLGASEFYGKNSNSDFFSEEALNPKDPEANWGHKTFETNPAHIFIKHFNKDPEQSIGKVVKSAYNENMHRVEVIMDIDKNKAPGIVEKLERSEEKRASGIPFGESDSAGISMGCKLLSGDVCSICGNRSKSKLEYCDHLRNHMGEMWEDGRVVCAYNPQPVFFDLSIVENPAAKEAAILKKVAESAEVSKKKDQLMWSEVRGYYSNDIPILKNAKGLMSKLGQVEKRFSIKELNNFSELGSFTSFLDSSSAMGIILKPEEFQYLALKKGGMEKIAGQYYDNNVLFPVTSISQDIPWEEQLSNAIIEKMAGHLDDRSCFEPYISLRLTKAASVKPVITHKNFLDSPLLLEISKAYNTYRDRIIDNLNIDKVAGIIKNNLNLMDVFFGSNIKIASLYGNRDAIETLISPITRVYMILG